FNLLHFILQVALNGFNPFAPLGWYIRSTTSSALTRFCGRCRLLGRTGYGWRGSSSGGRGATPKPPVSSPPVSTATPPAPPPAQPRPRGPPRPPAFADRRPLDQNRGRAPPRPGQPLRHRQDLETYPQARRPERLPLAADLPAVQAFPFHPFRHQTHRAGP